MAKKRLTTAERRALRSQKAQRAWLDDLGSAEDFMAVVDGLVLVVSAAAARHLLADDMRYRKSAEGKWLPIDGVDLAVTLHAVELVGEHGLSLSRLGQVFKLCGIGWSRAKGVECRELLVKARLVEKIGNYSAGKKGNQYKRIRQVSIDDDVNEWLNGLP